MAEAPLPPLEFEAHYLTNQEAFHRYALGILRTNDRAEKAVHRAFVEILRHWDGLLTEPDLQAQTWQLMRRVVIGELIDGLREDLAAMDSGIGLYPAIGKLSPRQFDAIVLRSIGGYDTKHIAWYMGLSPSTVTHHLRKAHERLASVHRRATRPTKKEDTP
ncbi:RNA polymerase sigma factor [Streptomyces sp. WAC01280]|uniref:RNA polymerase sigma factor n=1 Tax=Streptomyces sp. WAC01280 TaxID=2487424 RepID=UPI000F780A22|nr:sigma-70 family RNA polymerase sigma factor [Streptomyces sp. WAC01280]RSS57483.1 sigma-70 family RNA polymerase sigma factor [Streptomyces sp. WAC01280]